jgi:hypothetical protein
MVETATASTGTIVNDAELKVINRVCKELNRLTEPVKGRVLGYVLNRYAAEIGVKLVPAPESPA